MSIKKKVSKSSKKNGDSSKKDGSLLNDGSESQGLGGQ
jgi:hypothetical protein